MKQEQFIGMSFFVTILIPLLITTLGGVMYFRTFVDFLPYSKFLYGLTFCLALLLFTARNFRNGYSWGLVGILTGFSTVALRHSFYFPDIAMYLDALLLLAFFSIEFAALKYIFINPLFKAIRTFFFSLISALGFVGLFAAFLGLAGHPIIGTRMLGNNLLVSFILFVILGIGYSFAELAIIRLAMIWNVKPDLLSPDPEPEATENTEEDDD